MYISIIDEKVRINNKLNSLENKLPEKVNLDLNNMIEVVDLINGFLFSFLEILYINIFLINLKRKKLKRRRRSITKYLGESYRNF